MVRTVLLQQTVPGGARISLRDRRGGGDLVPRSTPVPLPQLLVSGAIMGPLAGAVLCRQQIMKRLTGRLANDKASYRGPVTVAWRIILTLILVLVSGQILLVKTVPVWTPCEPPTAFECGVDKFSNRMLDDGKLKP